MSDTREKSPSSVPHWLHPQAVSVPAAAGRLLVRLGRALRGEWGMPGDKWISHRVIMLGAIAAGISRDRDAPPATWQADPQQASRRAAIKTSFSEGVPTVKRNVFASRGCNVPVCFTRILRDSKERKVLSLSLTRTRIKLAFEWYAVISGRRRISEVSLPRSAMILTACSHSAS